MSEFNSAEITAGPKSAPTFCEFKQAKLISPDENSISQHGQSGLHARQRSNRSGFLVPKCRFSAKTGAIVAVNKISRAMKVPLSRKLFRFGLSIVLALFGPFILPPHVVGVYDPLISLLLSPDFWSGETEGAFYVIFCAEWAIYFPLIYCVSKAIFKLNRKDGKQVAVVNRGRRED